MASIFQFQLDWNRCQRSESGGQCAEVDQIFLGGDESVGVTSPAQFQQFFYVVDRVRMMIAIYGFCRGTSFSGPTLREEILRAGASAKYGGAHRPSSW